MRNWILSWCFRWQTNWFCTSVTGLCVEPACWRTSSASLGLAIWRACESNTPPTPVGLTVQRTSSSHSSSRWGYMSYFSLNTHKIFLSLYLFSTHTKYKIHGYTKAVKNFQLTCGFRVMIHCVSFITGFCWVFLRTLSGTKISDIPSTLCEDLGLLRAL